MHPGNIVQLIHEIPDRVDADLRKEYARQEFIERHCPTLEDYSDDALIEELESRGWVCVRENEIGNNK